MEMFPAYSQLTFTTWITVCKACGGEINMYRMDSDGVTRIWPCGHEAHMVVRPESAAAGDAAA